MRILTTRLLLGTLVLGTLALIAEPAEGGPFRRRARNNADCCPTPAYGYAPGYSMNAPMGYGYTMSAPMGYAMAPSCYSGNAVAYGGGYGMQLGYGMQPGYNSFYGSGPIQTAGGYGTPNGNLIPAGGFPQPMPGGAGTAVPVNSERVNITDGTFEPATLNIKPGTTVRWTNEGQKPHTVTSDKGDWGSPQIPAGGEFTATFTQPGTFEYHCDLHKGMMKATIVVK